MNTSRSPFAAVAQCGAALGDYSNHNPYYLNLAEAYADHNNFPLSNWALEQVTIAQPTSAELLHCGAVYLRLDRPARAVDMYRQAIERDPRNAAAYLQLGDLYRRLELPDEMREVYQSGQRHLPGEPALMLAWAQNLSEIGGADHEAIDLLQRALKHQPRLVEAHLLLGQTVWPPGRFDGGPGALPAGIGPGRAGIGQCD